MAQNENECVQANTSGRAGVGLWLPSVSGGSIGTALSSGASASGYFKVMYYPNLSAVCMAGV